MLEYTVHSCEDAKVPTTAKVGGRDVEASLPGLIVELVDDVQGHGVGHGHTFRLVPESDAEFEKHKKLFAPGNRVRLSFSAVKGAA